MFISESVTCGEIKFEEWGEALREEIDILSAAEFDEDEVLEEEEREDVGDEINDEEKSGF